MTTSNLENYFKIYLKYRGCLSFVNVMEDKIMEDVLNKINPEDFTRIPEDRSMSLAHMICSDGFINLMKYILSFKEININVVTKNGNNSLLHYAVIDDNIEMYNLLIKDKRIDLNIKHISGRTYDEMAYWMDSKKIIGSIENNIYKRILIYMICNILLMLSQKQQ